LIDAPSQAHPTRALAWAGLLALLTAAAYLPVLHAGWIWDDDYYVTRNLLIREPGGLLRIWFEPTSLPQYYPLVHTTFWMEYRLFGVGPRAYHVTNVVLHALGALLLWRVLLRLKIPGAFLAASVFAVHPVHVESVAWVTERKNVLSGFFFFASLLAWLRFDPLEGPASRRPWMFYALSLSAFACALLSKTVTCSLPALILLLVYWKRGRIRLGEGLALAPFFVLGVVLARMTIGLEVGRVGAGGVDWQLSPLQRVLLAGRAVWFYAWKLVWPVGLSFSYPQWRIDSGELWQFVFPVGVAAVVALLFALRGRLGRAPLVAVLAFIGMLVPALGFFDVFPMRFSYVADHFQYLASVALIVPAAGLLTSGMERASRASHGSRKVGWLGAALLLGTLMVLTWRQAGIYEAPERLWTDTIQKNPSSWLAQNNLAVEFVRQGRLQEAARHFDAALHLRPEVVQVYVNAAKVLKALGRDREAAAHLERAVALEPSNAEARELLGMSRMEAGDFESAERELRELVRIVPGMASGHALLGRALERTGQRSEALSEYWEALRLDPRDDPTIVRQVRLLAGCQPADSPSIRQAIRLAEVADVRTGHSNPQLLGALAAAYAAKGRFADAEAAARKAMTLAPSTSFEDPIEAEHAAYAQGRVLCESRTIDKTAKGTD